LSCECEASLQAIIELLGMLDIRGVSRVLDDVPLGSVATNCLAAKSGTNAP
jgi:hypothetical protein